MRRPAAAAALREPRAPGTAGILRLAAPLVVSFWMRAAVTFVDTIYASLLGDAAVAAVGLALPFEFLMIAVWVGLSTGLTAALSRAMGARAGGQIEQYLRAAREAVWVASPVFGAIGVAIWFAAPRLDFAPEVARSFQVYGSVLVGGSALTTFWSVIPDSLVKAHHDTRSTMWAGIWTNLLNLGLNSLFLFVFGWGVFGIALSTVLGRIGGLTYALLRAARLETGRRSRGGFETATLDSAPRRRILVLAGLSSLTFVLMATESALANALLARRPDATEAIAAFSIHARIVLFALQPVIATGVAMLPFAAHRFGAADVDGVRRGFARGLSAATLYSTLVAGPILVLAAPWIAAGLSESELTRTYATFGLRMAPLACLAGAPFLLCRPVFEARNRGRPGLVMAFVRYVVLAAPLGFGGMRVAQAAGAPAFHGLIGGLILASAIGSAVFLVWLARDLRGR